jgi:outer membrane beta-barrel protein
MNMRRLNAPLTALLLFSVPVLTLGTAPAIAQEDDEEEEDDSDLYEDDEEGEDEEDEEEADEDEDEDEEEAAGGAAEAGGDAGGDAYAAADAPAGDGAAESGSDADLQTIFVIQSKPRLVGGSFEFAPQIAQSVNDRFTSHTGLILSGIYHLKENVAFELSIGGFFWWDNPGGANDRGPRMGGRDTEMTVEIRQKERLAPELVQLYRLTWLTTADLQWSPVYGKVSVHDVQLGQFNVYLSVGAGITGLQLENQQALGEFYQLPGPLGPEIGPMTLTTTIGGGLRFYFGRYFGVRLEIRDYVNALSVLQQDVTSEPFSTFDVTNTVLAQLGASFIF